jgi:SAM-dependent methyltransferase
MKIIETCSKGLGVPVVYRTFQRLIGSGGVRRAFLNEYVRPVPKEKVLDIGCGPADILDYLPGVDYLGLDISPEYIHAARKRFGKRGRFCCGDVGLATVEQESGTFSLVMATGVLHHLDDQTAAKLFDLARLALGPGGRLVTFDGCYEPKQSGIARWMLSHDRGTFVRAPADYERLASVSFANVELSMRHDLLRIPYTHVIMRCSS